MYECLPTCISLHSVCAWPYTQRPEESIRSPGTGVADECESLHACWKIKPGYPGRLASTVNY